MPDRSMIATLAGLATLSCGDATGPTSANEQVSIRTDRAAYRPVDLILITTITRSRQTIYDDHCGGEVQGLEFTGTWNGSYGASRGCSFQDASAWRGHGVGILPGASHVDTLHVNSRAYTGTWRVEL